LKRKNLISITPFKEALKDLILALKLSAEALALLLIKRLRTSS